jgi:hypothetical protein
MPYVASSGVCVAAATSSVFDRAKRWRVTCSNREGSP